jgi:hypothetical protein
MVEKSDKSPQTGGDKIFEVFTKSELAFNHGEMKKSGLSDLIACGNYSMLSQNQHGGAGAQEDSTIDDVAPVVV